MNDCIAVNIQDMLKAIGEEKLSKLLSDFSCPLNREVEDFVRNKSIDFAQRKLSITYLVMKRTNEDKNILVGIYTLSHKAIEITNSLVIQLVKSCWDMRLWTRIPINTIFLHSLLHSSERTMPYRKNIRLLEMNWWI